MLTPYFVGSGRSADALKKCWAILSLQHPEWELKPSIQLARGQKLKEAIKDPQSALLLITSPHGVHAEAILEGEKAGVRAIVAEKPACVSLPEVAALRSVRTPVAVCHVYRQMWGPQTLKQMIHSGEMGEVFTIEGRYWQSSTAQKALEPARPATAWKNDPKLSGGSDALIDLGVHWADTVCYLMSESKFSGSAAVSYANAEAPHRDSHIQMHLKFSKNRTAMASVSKTVHGSTNHFELNVLGTRKSATWTFLSPDTLFMGSGNTTSTVVRQDNLRGSQLPAFHAMGWVEGYLEILRQLILDLLTPGSGEYPALAENLDMIESLLSLKRSN